MIDEVSLFTGYYAAFSVAMISAAIVHIENEFPIRRTMVFFFVYMALYAAIITIFQQTSLLVGDIYLIHVTDNAAFLDSSFYIRDTILIIVLMLLAVIGVSVVFYKLLKIVKKLLKTKKRTSSDVIIPQNERAVNMLGSFIAKRRKELGLSLAKLAKKSGHPVSSIHGIENGDNQNPRFEIIIDLCKALDVSLDEMKAAFLLDNRRKSK